MHPDDELPAGWLTQFRRGVFSGAGLLLLLTALCAVPAFLAWLVPGADTSPASSAVKAGALLALSAPHGGLVLAGTPITLTPLLVTGALGWLVAGQVRRSQSWSVALGLPIGYGVAAGLLADWARLGSTRAPVLASSVAALVFVAAVGLLVRTVEVGWPRLPDRARRVCRAAGVATGCYLAAGALLAAGMLVLHLSDAVALQRQLAPGAAGLPVALLGLAAAGNAVLAGVGYLTGPGFAIGSHTSVSVAAVSAGPLPTFPLLAAVPHGRPATLTGLALVLVLALLVGWLVLRTLAAAESCWPRLVVATVTAGLTGLLLAVLSGLGSGSLGPGTLRLVGERWWAVGGSSVLVVLFGAAAWLVVELVRGRAAVGEPARIYPLPAARLELAKAEQPKTQAKADQAKTQAKTQATVQAKVEPAGPKSGSAKSGSGPDPQAERRRNAG
jgi:hypothetical protein